MKGIVWVGIYLKSRKDADYYMNRLYKYEEMYPLFRDRGYKLSETFGCEQFGKTTYVLGTSFEIRFNNPKRWENDYTICIDEYKHEIKYCKSLFKDIFRKNAKVIIPIRESDDSHFKNV
jgi:hypothetical protein